MRNDACLLVDVYCYECKKLMALSNAYQYDGRYYCWKCIDLFQPNPLLTAQSEGKKGE